MSEHRIHYLLSCLHFDDQETRKERIRDNSFTPIRQIWGKFITNRMRYYSTSQNLTIDEQLLIFRSNCRFKVYIPNELAKYGLKVVMMNDARTSYMINEQLLSFRGNCRFNVYIPNNPVKYGLKVVMMNDARISYMINENNFKKI